MNKKINKYKAAPGSLGKAIDSSEIIEDFLPSPDQLVEHEKTKRVTLILTANSYFFFKAAAQKNKVSYQKMIRYLLDRYSRQHQGHI